MVILRVSKASRFFYSLYNDTQSFLFFFFRLFFIIKYNLYVKWRDSAPYSQPNEFKRAAFFVHHAVTSAQ